MTYRRSASIRLTCLVVFGLLLAACGTPQPEPLPPPPTAEPATPEPTATLEPTLAPTVAPTATPTAVPTATPRPTATLAPTAAPTVSPTSTMTTTAGPSLPFTPTGELTGTVSYLTRIALPDNAVVEVELRDTSDTDAPGTVIASQSIETKGQQVPISFTLEYDPAVIEARSRYVLSARITADDRLLFINTTAQPVLTGNAPATGVEVLVEPVVNVAASGSPTATLVTSNTATLTGTVAYRDRRALPPNALIVIQIQDVSRADAPAVVVASAQFAANGRQVPLPFTIRYDPALIDAGADYALRARILSSAGVAQYRHTDRYAVLTRGAPLSGVDVIVAPADSAAPADDLVAITGTVGYAAGSAPQVGAVIDVQLHDVSDPAAPAVLARQILTPSGQSASAPFALYYDPFAIDPAARYGISATATLSDEVKWLTAQAYPVLTAGELTDVDVTLEPVGGQPVSGQPPAPIVPPPPLATGNLTGTITYREKVALPAGAVIQVRLLDVTSIESPAITIGEQTIETTGEQVPIPFAIAFDAAQIDPNHFYLLLATITINGELEWLNSQPVWVLTYGNPGGNAEVVVGQAP